MLCQSISRVPGCAAGPGLMPFETRSRSRDDVGKPWGTRLLPGVRVAENCRLVRFCRSVAPAFGAVRRARGANGALVHPCDAADFVARVRGFPGNFAANLRRTRAPQIGRSITTLVEVFRH